VTLIPKIKKPLFRNGTVRRRIARQGRNVFCAAAAVLLAATALPAQSPPPDRISMLHVQTSKATVGNRPALLKDLDSSLATLVEKVSPAVVQIIVTGFGPVTQPGKSDVALLGRQQALGSGVILDPNGYIITNAHVIEGAQRIRVVLPQPPADSAFEFEGSNAGRILDAKIIGVHHESDLAVIKVEASHLPTLSLASAGSVRQGQLVFAVGNPEGLQNSVTMGVVSSPIRQPDPDSPMVYVQTDAPINPGNSGGPLVDIDGNLVGINTMILTEGGGSEGLGFAVPAPLARFVYRNLREHGFVYRASIDAEVQEITPDLADGLGLERKWGAIVSDVTGATTKAAGLQVGDVIMSVDGRAIRGVPGYNAMLYLHPLDQPLTMVVLRERKRVSLSIPVRKHHDDLDQLPDISNLPKDLVPKLGVFALDLNNEVKSALKTLRSDSGVLVVAQAAAVGTTNTGLKAGDVVRTVNNRPVASLEQLRHALDSFKAGDAVALQVERSGKLQYLSFELD
jgi:serine protease Do